MNNAEKLNAWFKKFEHRLHNDVPGIIAETAIEYFKERFVKADWDGKPWQPFKNKSREPKRGTLMKRSPGGLMSTINAPIISAAKVRVSAGSSRVPYARVHNEGLRVRAVQYVKPHHNNNFMGKGKRVQIQGFSRKIDFKMPKRQFMGHSAILNKRIIQRIKLKFNQQ